MRSKRNIERDEQLFLAAQKLSKRIRENSSEGDWHSWSALAVSWLDRYSNGTEIVGEFDAEFFVLVDEIVTDLLAKGKLTHEDNELLTTLVLSFKPQNRVELKILRYFFVHTNAHHTLSLLDRLHSMDIKGLTDALSEGERYQEHNSKIVLRRVYSHALKEGDFIARLPPEVLLEFYGVQSSTGSSYRKDGLTVD